ncbi:hypothetical protein TNCV_3318061 [Trichonephila clavipes]|nr:hypothetical protein TNCV_3318061 [Trichonephila clavipes]
MDLVPKVPAFMDKQVVLSIEDANERRLQSQVGTRVVDCCAHGTSVLWYLGYWRHNHTQTKPPSPGYADTLQDTADG